MEILKAQQSRPTSITNLQKSNTETKNYVDMEVITLRQLAKELVMSRLYDWGMMPETIELQEFVEIKNKKLTVGLNIDMIDNTAIVRAFELTSKIDDLTADNTYHFGDTLNVSCR